MKKMLFALIAALSLGMALPTTAQADGFDAQVVLKVGCLDDAGMARLAREAAKDRAATIEYSCTWSGVLVLKFSGAPSGDRADAIMLARRLLTAAGLEKGMEVLHVHAEASGPGKC